MPFFYVWETVDFPIEVTAEDGSTGILTNLKAMIITLEQSGVTIEKDLESPDVGIDAENDIVNLHLSQEDTGTFMGNSTVNLQINFLYEDSERDTTAEAVIETRRNLHREVME